MKKVYSYLNKKSSKIDVADVPEKIKNAVAAKVKKHIFNNAQWHQIDGIYSVIFLGEKPAMNLQQIDSLKKNVNLTDIDVYSLWF